jgi:hypothetical protein
MHPWSRYILGAVATMSVLSGCSSGQPGLAPAKPALQSRFTSIGPSKNIEAVCLNQPNLLYVSQRFSNTVNIYNNLIGPGNPPPLYTITASQGLNLPAGMIMDQGTVLYVANFGAQKVLAFKKCGTGPGAIYQDAPFSPIDVAVSSGSTGAVYVSNFAPANVTVFPIPSLNYVPSLTLTDPNARAGFGITVDKFNNCFWSFQDNTGQGRVDRFVNCLMPGVTIALFPVINGPPGGIQFDFPANRMLLNDQTGNSTYRIPSPWTGPPFLFPQAVGGSPFFLSLRNNQTRLYVADPGNAAVQRYKYPSGVMQPPLTNGLSTTGGVTGVAVYPAAPL